MAETGLVRRALAVAWVRPEALNVAPELLGAPLAPQGRRVLAIGVDIALVGLLSTTGMFWAVAGMGALAIQLRRRVPPRPWWRTVLMTVALAWLAVVAYAHAADWLIHHDDPARVAAAAREDGDADDEDEDPARTAASAAGVASAGSLATAAATAAAATAMSAASGSSLLSATSAAPAAAAAAASDATAPVAQAARIAALEAQLAAARRSRPLHWRDALQRRLHRLGLSFGWAIAYFTLLPLWWRGQTVGKRLFGLRIVHLTGRPLRLMDCFGRYGGYAAGLATGGIGLLQVLWDPNRQAVQDKLAHTVVVDLHGPRAA